MLSTLSNAQDMAMATGEGLTPVTNTTAVTAAESKPDIEYTFRTYGDIPVAKTAFEEEHYLGNDVSKKWNTFIANYRHEYSVSVGLSNSGYEFVKPAVYNAVQRANPEMQKRAANVIRAIAESDENPIVSIHDHGAGGHLNCLSELVEATGGHIDMSKLPIGDPTLSAKEIVGNESQERMAY